MAGSRALDESGAGLPSAPIVEALAERLRAAPALLLVLDYDGTLVPFALTPELAGPDREVIALLQDLAARPRTEVHVVSGRTRETLESWLGPLPIGLHAEHGLSSRAPSAGAWVTATHPASGMAPGGPRAHARLRRGDARRLRRGEERRARLALSGR